MKRQLRFLEGRWSLTLLLGAAFLWSLLSVGWPHSLVHPGGGKAVREFFTAILDLELSPGFLKLAIEDTWTTLAYAFAGVTLAVAIGFPLGVLASGTVVRGRRARWANIAGVRLVLAALRSIHELVWAWLFVVAIGLSPLAGVLALGIPYAGILGRIYAEQLQDTPQGPLRSLRASGASEWKVFWYGRFPQAFPDMLSYTFYRLECGVRSAAIMSFIGLGGLGYRIQLSLGDLHYNEVWTLLLFMVLIIVAINVWSSLTRKSLTR
ncbi:MAG: ABC transporter permease subunit [Chloroflexi bacterium]|nr:ABC transporter permease subunit [Chloroflexota bacterium]